MQATARGSQFLVARDPGAGAEVEFEGEGVELIGCLIEAGGRLEVRLDDQPPVVAESYLFARDDMPLIYPEEALWFSGRIAPGRHVLRVCLLEDKHPQSKGRYAGLQAIVVFGSNTAAAGN